MDAFGVILITGVFATVCAIKFILEPNALMNIMKAAVMNPAISILSAILPLILGLIIVVSFGPSALLTRADALAVTIGGFLIVNGLFRLWAENMWRALIKQMGNKKRSHVPMTLLLLAGALLMLIGLGVMPLS